MSDNGPIRLSKAAKELNVGLTTVVDFLASKGIKIEGRPNTKLDSEAYQFLVDEYAPDRAKKQKSEGSKSPRNPKLRFFPREPS